MGTKDKKNGGNNYFHETLLDEKNQERTIGQTNSFIHNLLKDYFMIYKS